MKFSIFLSLIIILALSLHHSSYKHDTKTNNKTKDLTIEEYYEKSLDILEDRLNDLKEKLTSGPGPKFLPNPLPDDKNPKYLPNNVNSRIKHIVK